MIAEGKEKIKVIHGAGGKAMDELIGNHVLNTFTNKSAGKIGLDNLDDGATIEGYAGRTLVLTTDSHVVSPLFFPGGDIGRLAVSGTVNDLAVMGADPLALTSSIIVEEGLEMNVLDRIFQSMEETCREAGVPIITGDTKVMERGNIDRIAINTAGVGVADEPVPDSGFSSGDKIIVTGTIGDHGMALIQFREGLTFKTKLKSDTAPLNHLLKIARDAGDVTGMKDPTRGGLAAGLNEMADKSHLGLTIHEGKIPIKDPVMGVSDLIGISPYNVANEGKAIIMASPGTAEDVVSALRDNPLGKDAKIIGEVTEERPGKVILETEVGGRRFLDAPLGDPVPRIC
ncbi:MAG: hydrogenase expression/formation protein HypE [Candidatus Acetothermia bacterium]